MYEYYFKIKKGDIEFECSTSDKQAFEEQLADWINGLVRGETLEVPSEQEDNLAEPKDFAQKPERSGFINVKNLASINEMQDFNLDFNVNKTDEQDELNSDFERELNESLQSPKTEVIEKQDSHSEFEEYVAKYAPSSSVDNLIVTALYISNVENCERFTLKQLNAKLVPVLGAPVDHSVLQNAIEQGYVRIVPDLTDTSEFTEYELTESGEGYFVV